MPRAFSARLQHALSLFHVDDFEQEAAAGNPIPREVLKAAEAGMLDDDIAKIIVAAYRSAKEVACISLESATKVRKDRITVPVKPMPR